MSSFLVVEVSMRDLEAFCSSTSSKPTASPQQPRRSLETWMDQKHQWAKTTLQNWTIVRCRHQNIWAWAKACNVAAAHHIAHSLAALASCLVAVVLPTISWWWHQVLFGLQACSRTKLIGFSVSRTVAPTYPQWASRYVEHWCRCLVGPSVQIVKMHQSQQSKIKASGLPCRGCWQTTPCIAQDLISFNGWILLHFYLWRIDYLAPVIK